MLQSPPDGTSYISINVDRVPVISKPEMTMLVAGAPGNPRTSITVFSNDAATTGAAPVLAPAPASAPESGVVVVVVVLFGQNSSSLEATS